MTLVVVSGFGLVFLDGDSGSFSVLDTIGLFSSGFDGSACVETGEEETSALVGVCVAAFVGVCGGVLITGGGGGDDCTMTGLSTIVDVGVVLVFVTAAFTIIFGKGSGVI